jgi:hypothetical protein
LRLILSDYGYGAILQDGGMQGNRVFGGLRVAMAKDRPTRLPRSGTRSQRRLIQVLRVAECHAERSEASKAYVGMKQRS